MVTDDIALIDEICSIIDNELINKGHDYSEYEFTHLRYEELGMNEYSIIVKENKKVHTDVSIDDDEFSFKLDDLHSQMKSRGENWKSMILKFSNGEAKANFSYKENPAPW